MIIIPNKLSFELGKLIAGYVFLGTCITVVLFPYLDKTNIPKLQDILTVGAIIGGFLSTFQIHRLAGYFYIQNSLKEALEQSKMYTEFENQRNIFYFRFLYMIGFFLLLLPNRIVIFLEFLFSEDLINSDLDIFYYGIVLLFVYSVYLFLKSFYSNLELLVIFRFLNYASRKVDGFYKLDDLVKDVDTELKIGNWKEAKYKFIRLIKDYKDIILAPMEFSERFVDRNPIKRNEIMMGLKSFIKLDYFGFEYIQFKNQISHSDIKTIEDRINPLVITSARGNFSKTGINNLNENNQNFKSISNSWKVVTWEDYLEQNLPLWLNINRIKYKIFSIIPNRMKNAI